MKNKNSNLAGKMKAYSVIAGSLLATSQQADAQIIYTDLDPDVDISLNSVFELDLNNDGTSDYGIAFYTAGITQGEPRTGMFLICQTGNKVAASTGYNGAYVYPSALNLGAQIGSGLNFYSKRVGNYSTLLTIGTHWFFFMGTYGKWFGATDKYLGLQLSVSGNTYYGWARMDVGEVGGPMMVLKDYAYNTIPDDPILAGETSSVGCADNNEPNNIRAKATPISTNVNYKTLINPSGDRDFFRFKIDGLEPNIKVTLTDLPKNYNLFLFDKNGAKIAKSVHNHLEDEVIVHNNGDTGTYYIMVLGKDPNKFDPDNCYTLIAETSSSPFRLTEENPASASLDEDDFLLYPNPAQNNISLDGPMVTGNQVVVKVIDITGRELIVQNIQEFNQHADFDVSMLPAGTYIMEIRTNENFIIKKFMVAK